MPLCGIDTNTRQKNLIYQGVPDAYLRYLRAMGKEDVGLLGNEWDGFWIEVWHNDAAVEEKLKREFLALQENQEWLYQFLSSQTGSAPDT